MLGTACRTCPRCLENLAQISEQTGLSKIERVAELEAQIERLRETIDTLELTNKTLLRRVESLEGLR